MDHLTTTLLLIDDHPMLRSGIRQLINTMSDFNIIGEAGTGSIGIELAEQFEPDIILLDINMHETNGLDVLRYLREKNISSRIIMFTVSDDKQDIITALKNGADGYLLKSMEPEAILHSLRQVAEGKTILDDAISQIVLDYMRNEQSINKDHNINLLTVREKEIFELLVQGFPNKLIARQLDIVESTVKVHVKSILKKLNFKSRMEITVWFLQDKNKN